MSRTLPRAIRCRLDRFVDVKVIALRGTRSNQAPCTGTGNRSDQAIDCANLYVSIHQAMKAVLCDLSNNRCNLNPENLIVSSALKSKDIYPLEFDNECPFLFRDFISNCRALERIDRVARDMTVQSFFLINVSPKQLLSGSFDLDSDSCAGLTLLDNVH